MPEAQDAVTDGHCSLQLGVWGDFEPPSGSREEPWRGQGDKDRGSS